MDSSTGPGLVRRVRRAADLSQRALAAELGVSQSMVARWETGRSSPPLVLLEVMAALAGLRVALLDADDHAVVPMRGDAMLDRAGRHLPAHADVIACGWWAPRGSHLTVEGITARRESERLGRPQVRWSTQLGRGLGRLVGGIPEDHPTRSELIDELRTSRHPETVETPREAPYDEK